MDLQDLDELERWFASAAPEKLALVRRVTSAARSVAPTASAIPDRSASLVTSMLGGPVALEDSWWDGSPPPADPAPFSGALGARYVDLGPIGEGGMGEVRRVRDLELNRVVAMKRLRAEVTAHPAAAARFVEEIQTTAQLQHPGIVPVYDAGRDPDGRVWFTMKEVRGRTLSDVLEEVHDASADGWATTESGWSLRRLVAALHQASLAVAYAHDRGVVHRDLKPDNVMLGAFGEVQVMDWGLCKVRGRSDLVTDDVVVSRARHATRMGHVMGTPAYMAPEQAAGVVDAVDERTDVYALGAILYEVLAGRPPYFGPTGLKVIHQVLAGPPDPLRRASRARSAAESGRQTTPAATSPNGVEVGDPSWSTPEVDPDLPRELVEACTRAMARPPADRYATATQFAEALQGWLDGSRRRERALEVVARADATVDEGEALRARADALRGEARVELEALPPWAPEEQKLPGWAKEAEADALDARASLTSLRRDQLLAGALTHAPDLPEAHAAMALDQRARHAAAERERDAGGAARAEVLLRSHLEALPERHPVRLAGAAYLRGVGAVTLVTDPEGAEVEVHRYEPHGRRLVTRRLGTLGWTPLVEVPLEMGSYLLVLRHPDRAEVRYPVRIGRGEHWAGVRPGGTAPYPIALPRPGDLDPDDVYVPAGWFAAGGGRPPAIAPTRSLWCDPFVMRRFPITNREYIAFLDDLVARGREEEAVRCCPSERGGTEGEQGIPIYGRDAAGRFVLRPDADGDAWDPDWPVVMIDWFSAVACARWHAERTGAPWRLPWDYEWEKAAAGVDGRLMPWGDGSDPTFYNMRDSGPRPLPTRVDTFPIDVGPYGHRGVGGNVASWCVDVFTPQGPPFPDGVVHPFEDEGAAPGRARRIYRGGNWFGFPTSAHRSFRSDSPPGVRHASLGVRLARSW